MAICKWCNTEMMVAVGCPANMEVLYEDGVTLPSIPFGKEDGMEGQLKPWTRCHDCNVLAGEQHHPGCDVEQCPRCGGQLISCNCLVAEVEVEDDWKPGGVEQMMDRADRAVVPTMMGAELIEGAIVAVTEQKRVVSAGEAEEEGA